MERTCICAGLCPRKHALDKKVHFVINIGTLVLSSINQNNIISHKPKKSTYTTYMNNYIGII